MPMARTASGVSGRHSRRPGGHDLGPVPPQNLVGCADVRFGRVIRLGHDRRLCVFGFCI